MVQMGIFVVGFALFVFWADRKHKRHSGNMLRNRAGGVKFPDPLDRTDAQ